MQGHQVLSAQEEVFSKGWQQASLSSPQDHGAWQQTPTCSGSTMTSPTAQDVSSAAPICTSSPAKQPYTNGMATLGDSMPNGSEWKPEVKWDQNGANGEWNEANPTGTVLNDFDLSKLTTTDETLLEDLSNIMSEELTDVGPDTIQQVLEQQMLLGGGAQQAQPSAQQLAAHVLQANKAASGGPRRKQGPLMALLTSHQQSGLLMPANDVHPAYRGEAWQSNQPPVYVDSFSGKGPRRTRVSGVDSTCSSSNGGSPMDYSYQEAGEGAQPSLSAQVTSQTGDSGDSSSVASSGSSGANGASYWWQYNVQCKGPKGKRLSKPVEAENPYRLHDFEDPVFDPENPVDGIRHGGKARKGDGNDITPNPRRLFMIGKELEKLAVAMKDLNPALELAQDHPAAVHARKEKNKLASRVCRLKKKAQHEAHKVKLHGLDCEHNELSHLIERVKREIFKRLRLARDDKTLLLRAPPVADIVESMVASSQVPEVAGRTAMHVNDVIEREKEKDALATRARSGR